MTNKPNDQSVTDDAPVNRVSNRKVPLVSLARRVKRFFRKGWSTAYVFNRIYTGNRWRGKESVSGPGSDSSQTQALSRKLPLLLREIKVRSILDAPCGDLFWMRDLDLDGLKYTGIDIVSELIEENQKRFAASEYRFLCSNLICDPLPAPT
jgi:2-polyprenyl-3-methyl-5-hydroxy-6-metoxy-1,4-benzoquinol methylase